MQVILFKRNEEGEVGVVYPTSEFEGQLEELVVNIPEGAEWRIISSEDLPSRDTRANWFWTTDGPVGVSS